MFSAPVGAGSGEVARRQWKIFWHVFACPRGHHSAKCSTKYHEGERLFQAGECTSGYCTTRVARWCHMSAKRLATRGGCGRGRCVQEMRKVSTMCGGCHGQSEIRGQFVVQPVTTKIFARAYGARNILRCASDVQKCALMRRPRPRQTGEQPVRLRCAPGAGREASCHLRL